jgi:hypothetical protein
LDRPWFHGTWITAPDAEALDWYDELDALRWSIRCVRRFRDGSLKAYSYASPDWRNEMPELPIPPLQEINDNSDFFARRFRTQSLRPSGEKQRVTDPIS